MRSRYRFLPGALGMTVLLVVTASSASLAKTGAARTGCHPRGSTTIAATARSRVFRVSRLAPYSKVHLTYGCSFRVGRSVRFALPDLPLGYGALALAGPYVAYSVTGDCSADYCDPNSVVVQDLRTGRVRYVDGVDVAVAHVTGLVLRVNGAAAFITSTYDDTGAQRPGYEVVAVATGGPAKILDSGTAVDPGSLALAGKTMYWTAGGQPRSATLGD